ncbi:MAG TPA: hypothetical protein VGH56_11495 [Solirubrobacteraceae bacterium]|jgi:hypothetical protein
MSTSTSLPTGQQADRGAQQTVQEAADQAQEKAQQLADQAQEKGQQAAAQAKDKLRQQLDQRSAQTAEQINQRASDLRAVSDSLRQQGKDGPARAADRLAAYAEKAGGYLRERDSDALLFDAEDFARRQPWAVGAGALVLGFAASRFLKASSSKRYSTRSAGQAPGTSGRPAIPSASPAPAGTPAVYSTRSLGSTPPIGRASGI